jgi:GxxExxY protein
MNTANLKHGAITEKIIGVFYDVYNELGHGFLESVYHRAIALALEQAGLKVQSKVPIPVTFRGHDVGTYEADLVVEELVIVELKTAKALEHAHEAQLFHYLRATPLEVGLLLNFGTRAQFKRVASDNSGKHARAAAASSDQI